jgi:hypothetical protein
MTDVLVITGPVNAAQLRQPELSPGTRTIYVGSGGGTGSSDMFAATDAWLGGTNLRARVEQEVPDLHRLGVIWFSAGHGSVQALLRRGTDPSDVQAWLCLDGLYTAWNHVAPWAEELGRAAMNASTTLLASASTSTPGQYADSRSAWQQVVKALGVPDTPGARATAEQLGLPAPNDAYQHGAMLVCGYKDIDHHHQVPAMREGFANWWNRVREAEWTPPADTLDVGGSDGWILPTVALGLLGFGVGSVIGHPFLSSAAGAAAGALLGSMGDEPPRKP